MISVLINFCNLLNYFRFLSRTFLFAFVLLLLGVCIIKIRQKPISSVKLGHDSKLRLSLSCQSTVQCKTIYGNPYHTLLTIYLIKTSYIWINEICPNLCMTTPTIIFPIKTFWTFDTNFCYSEMVIRARNSFALTVWYHPTLD